MLQRSNTETWNTSKTKKSWQIYERYKKKQRNNLELKTTIAKIKSLVMGSRVKWEERGKNKWTLRQNDKDDQICNTEQN